MIAVDPGAEVALLGEEATGYLAPLLAHLPERSLKEFGPEWRQLVDSGQYPFASLLTEVASMNEYDTIAVPVVARLAQPDSLRLDISVTQVPLDQESVPVTDEEIRALVQQYAPELANNTAMQVSVDASVMTAPFSEPSFGAIWPGTPTEMELYPSTMQESQSELSMELTARPQFSVRSQAHTFSVDSLGTAGADGRPHTAATAKFGLDLNSGITQIYRQSTQLPEPEEQVLLLPLGSFDLNALTDSRMADVADVPSGIYDGAPTYQIAGPDQLPLTSAPDEPDEIFANFSGVDFITAPPGAFTDLLGGQQLRGEAPIDVIRVRVAGIDSYSLVNQEKVAQVASGIAALGLDTYVVAGSSVQQVVFEVPENRMGDSGLKSWIAQEWSTLGAVVVSSEALADVHVFLLAAVFMVILGSWVVALTSSASVKIHQVHVLHRLGWKLRSIRWYLLAPHLPTVVLIAVSTVVSSRISQTLPVWFFGAVLLTAMMLTVWAVALPIYRARSRYVVEKSVPQALWKQRTRSMGVMAPWQIAWRRLIKAPYSLILALTASGMVSVVVGAAMSVYLDASARAGSTRIAAYLWQTTAGGFLLLVGAGLGATVLTLFMGLRATMLRREHLDQAMVKIGFTSSLRLRIHRIHVLIIAGAMMIIGLIFSGSFAIVGENSASVALVCGLSALLLSIITAGALGWMRPKDPMHATSRRRQ